MARAPNGSRMIGLVGCKVLTGHRPEADFFLIFLDFTTLQRRSCAEGGFFERYVISRPNNAKALKGVAMGVEDLRFELGENLPSVPLAHRQPVFFGPLSIEPALRRISDRTGRSRKIEPLVMQVLLALVSADGATLSRDDLIAACWEGRIVTDDAVNRVMSRLRRIFADLSNGEVMLETVAKVGFRLVALEPVLPIDGVSAFPKEQATALPPTRRRPRWVLALAGIVLVATTTLVGAWADLGTSGIKSEVTIGVESVASTSSDRESRAFASSLTSDLALLAGAISRVSFIDDTANKSNNLDYLVRIAVDRDGDRLVARARLVSEADGAVLWSGRFEELSNQPDRLRERVAMQTAGVMRCGLDRSVKMLGDPSTIRLFFAACNAVKNEDFAQGRSFAQQVVARRPDVAAGWACLAMTTLLAAWGPDVSPEVLHSAEEEARRYARRALSLDPQSGRAFQALAVAERSGSPAQFDLLEQGIAAEPELPELHSVQAIALFNAGYTQASVTPAQRALALDPTSRFAYVNVVRRLLATGRIEEGRAMQNKAERLWPDEPNVIRQRIYMLADEPDPRAALSKLDALVAKLPPGERLPPLLRSGLRWKAGSDDLDLAALDREAEDEFAHNPASAWYIAAAFNSIGDSDRGLKWVERAPKREAAYQWGILFWPNATAMRRDPRFFKAMAELGLVTDWRARGQWPDFCSDPKLRYDCRASAARLAASGSAPTT